MNTSQLWFTGRNLPLLATSSPSDLIRWSLLFGLAAQTLLWTTRPSTNAPIDEPFVTDAPVYDETFGRARRRLWRLVILGIMVIVPVALWAVTEAVGWLIVAAAVPLAVFLVRRRTPSLVALPMVVVLLLLIIGWVRAARSEEYEVFTWSRLLSRVDALYDEGKLGFDAAAGEILYNDVRLGMTSRPTGRTWLEAEVLRFNAMPQDERMANDRGQLDAAALGAARRPAQYYAAVSNLWRAGCLWPSTPRPSVLAVERLAGDPDDPTPLFRVTGNPRYNVSHAFHEPMRQGDAHAVTARDGATRTVPLIGPAWVNGRWTHAITSEASTLGLGWMRHLASALDQVPPHRRTELRSLTIDVRLQRVVQARTESAGRALHGRLLRAGAALPLPPRVAMTIMKSTTGEILATGSWPRASAFPYWNRRRAADASGTWEELEPPTAWIDGGAPAAIASRHSHDHNFTAIEMGSATKPFWAAAVLTTRPALHSLLIRNGECDHLEPQGKCYEERLFGRRLTPGWRVSGGGGWVGFDRYLALSDNRYQIRLGILGFASVGANGRTLHDGRGAAGSTRESINGQMIPWNRFPAFPPGMRITRATVGGIANLHDQPTAHALRDLFAVNTGATAPGGALRMRRLSMWSGSEHDDVGTSNPLDALTVVTPVGANLSLQRITSTRTLVGVLLGGMTNRWSNVHAAGAFSSWSLGRPIVPHIVAGRRMQPLAAREQRFDPAGAAASEHLRPGLAAIFDIGTARSIRPAIMRFRRLGYDVYAKSGTLASTDPDRPTSRILLTIVRGGNAPTNGITISFVAERADGGFATETVGAFLAANEALILQFLQ